MKLKIMYKNIKNNKNIVSCFDNIIIDKSNE